MKNTYSPLLDLKSTWSCQSEQSTLISQLTNALKTTSTLDGELGWTVYNLGHAASPPFAVFAN